MSLILDALKKSEAERRRGLPPTLHDRYGAPRRARRTPWVAGAGAVLLVAGLAGSWFVLGRGRADSPTDAPGNQIASSEVASTALVPETAAQPALPAPGADPVAPAAALVVAETPVSARQESAFGGVSGDGNGGSVSGGGLPVPQRAGLYTPTATLPPPATVAAPPMGPPPEVAPPIAVDAAVQPKPDPSPQAKPDPALVAAPQVSSPPPKAEPALPSVASDPAAQSRPDEVLPTMYQLPYGIRKDLPKLELSMHVYSPIASERFIVLNGKRFTLETAAPGPELNLIEIVADGAVLEFRGQRFLLPRQNY